MRKRRVLDSNKCSFELRQLLLPKLCKEALRAPFSKTGHVMSSRPSGEPPDPGAENRAATCFSDPLSLSGEEEEEGD